MVILEAQAVSKSYRGPNNDTVWALREVSLACARGQLTALAGPSGAGKTTLLALLGAIERPSAGRILFQGTDLTGCSGAERARARRAIGQIFQTFALLPQLSALENIAYPLIPRGVRRTERNRRGAEWLSRLGLRDQVHRPVRVLSGGEQQRVAVARAFAGEPVLILADEPTAHLDAGAAQTLLDEFRSARAAGTALVVASHDPNLLGLADRVCTLDAGRLVAGGPGAPG
jgi:putative ABC transport system ATP-binding protein